MSYIFLGQCSFHYGLLNKRLLRPYCISYCARHWTVRYRPYPVEATTSRQAIQYDAVNSVVEILVKHY